MSSDRNPGRPIRNRTGEGIRKRTTSRGTAATSGSTMTWSSIHTPPDDCPVGPDPHEEDDEEDFEKLLISSKDSTASSQSISESRFTKSDKTDLISMLYEGDNNRKNLPDDNDCDEEEDGDEVNFLQPKNSRKKRSKNTWSRNKKRNSELMKQLMTGEEEDPSPSDTNKLLNDDPDHESSLSICVQVFIPFLVAGFGTVGAGLLLDYVQHWQVFTQVSEVFILVPALLGLKGNLEMTLASRLSTAANTGLLDTASNKWHMSVGNIALIQAQAAVVALLAAMFAILMDWLPEGAFNPNHAVLLIASSLLTASVASFLLAILMIFVVIISHNMNINPDNVATPIAASLGDLTTLALLANFSSVLFYTTDQSIWLCCTVIFVLLALVPVWILIAHSNPSTRDVLYFGWTPVICAMAISSAGGMILDYAVARFKGLAVFQPVINGVGGNLVAVQASRISTFLHKRSILGVMPEEDSDLCASPLNTFCGSHIHAKTARVLLLIAVPGHVIFTLTIHLMQSGNTPLTPTFLVLYLSAAMIQILLLLFLARSLIMFMWQRCIDPDNSAIPYLTAFGDLTGTALLATAFYILSSIPTDQTIQKTL